MKTIKWLLSTIVIFGMISCGSGDKKEAKELLQKILKVVGIPYDIVVNICQDDNSNGICESLELQTKVTLNKGDSFDDIWQKITLTEDGRYFLETRDPTKPILLELQDEAKVTYDNGKFTVPFNGFKNSEQNETKELSILAALVDKGYFVDRDLENIRNLNIKNTQDKFYATLLNSLEENINILRTKGLDAQQTMLGNLKEIASELQSDGIKDTLPNDLNNCGANQVCVDNRLKTLGSKLLITDEESDTIIQEERVNATTQPLDGGSGKKLLISKEIDYSENNFGGTTSSTTSTTSYTYNNKNQSKDSIVTTVNKINGTQTYRSTETCIDNYDNQDRYIGNSCTEETSDESGVNQSNTSRDIFNYSDTKLVSSDYYHNGNLNNKWEVTRWDGDKAVELKSTSYENNEPTQTTIWTSTYTGNNPTHIEMTTSSSEGHSTIDRTFDNKKTPYYWNLVFMNINGSTWWGAWIGENNILKETTKGGSGDYTTTKINTITYNSSDMPIKIEERTTTSTTNDFVERTTTTYEYIEAK